MKVQVLILGSKMPLYPIFDIKGIFLKNPKQPKSLIYAGHQTKSIKRHFGRSKMLISAAFTPF